MTAINFPDSPSNGDTHVVGGVTYTYDSTETKWKTTINSNAFLPLTGGTVSGNIVLGGEIQHDGDTDTNISFDADTILFDTAGSERFRVGSSGQFGIGGATYGTSGQVLTSQGSGSAPQWANASNITYSTAQATTSGTSPIEFTDVPTGVKKITIIFDDVGTNTSGSHVNVQLSTGGTYATSGYTSTSLRIQNASTSVSDISSLGYLVARLDNANKALTGHAVLHNVSGNRWTLSGVCASTEPGDQNRSWNFGGFLDLGGTIDKLRVQGHTGTQPTWDSGQINVMYEV